MLPPNVAYKIADFLLVAYSLYAQDQPPPVWRPVQWKGLYFPNPLSPAGGIDKHARCIKAWWALGAGFIEIGTVTPLPQQKNPGVTLKRNTQQQALWNHLGFPGPGLNYVTKQLKKIQQFRPTPIFANIGKNRTTPNQIAYQDYIQCITHLYPYVDGFVINISSPNTKDLCQLAEPNQLKPLLKAIQNTLNHLPPTSHHKPSTSHNKPFISHNKPSISHNKKSHSLQILIKWSPDIPEKDFLLSLDTALECGVNGHILSNSSNGLCSYFPKNGGVSGRPLTQKAKNQLVLTQKHLGTQRTNQLLISTGGILTIDEVFQRLAMGADLVQVYSALVFQGPLFLKQVYKNIVLRK